MPYPPAIVANAVLYRARQRGLPISHLKLQKLVFFTHAWCLAIDGSPAVDERPEAWEYGPVFNSLYHRLKGCGHEAIKAFIETVDSRSARGTTWLTMPSSCARWAVNRSPV